jgi:hypothetical protein
MFDEYHNHPGDTKPPKEWLELVIGSAAAAGVDIHYVARESAYEPAAAAATEILKAAHEAAYTVMTDNTDGGESGFLIERRPSSLPAAAMTGQAVAQSRPSGQPHRRYIDVELYDHPPEQDGAVSWACPLLAGMWQLHRLGGIPGIPFPEPQLVSGDLDDWETWGDVPAIIQLVPDAPPFSAERTHSVLPEDFLPVESAVAQILGDLSLATGIPLDPRDRGYSFSHFPNS